MYQVEQNLIMHNRLTEHSATLEQDVTLILKRFNIPMHGTVLDLYFDYYSNKKRKCCN